MNSTEPHILQIKESCLYVKDLDRTEAFYHRKLGLPLLRKKKGRHVFFRAGTSVLLCFIASATREEKNLPPHYASGHQHLAFEVAPSEYHVWKQKVLNAGITIEHEQPWKHGLHSFYFQDPDEHVLEIVPQGIWE